MLALSLQGKLFHRLHCLQPLEKNKKMKYYFGGYYLIKPREANFGGIKNKKILTCSSCINDTLIDSWAISWATPIEPQTKLIREEFEINDEKLRACSGILK